MKISKPTIEILKNFSQINSNILIREGNLLRTISVGMNIFARATVEELTDSTLFDFGNGSREAANKVHATHFIKIKVSDILVHGKYKLNRILW
jgi:hypothetical protein